MLQGKEREFQDKVRNSKKVIEERANKLTEEHKAKIASVSEKIEKKIQAYERNMKNRIDILNLRVSQINQAN